ncbi:MAG TPA: helix-turn-helix domain-containing protein [Candidatus Nanoarchaeia archaeon]|nr:helix-turn-helix domain-containing protein [Candidatus Nanoarchaeia archaeon]
MVKNIKDLVFFVKKLEEEIKSRGRISKEEVIQRFCKYGGKEEWQIKSKKRTQDLADLRHGIYYILDISGENLVEIGKTLGGRDHSTVIHGRDVMKDYIKQHYGQASLF